MDARLNFSIVHMCQRSVTFLGMDLSQGGWRVAEKYLESVQKLGTLAGFVVAAHISSLTGLIQPLQTYCLGNVQVASVWTEVLQ